MKKDRVIPTTEKKIRFGCGHTSCAEYYFQIGGQEFGVHEEAFKKAEKCGDCLLQAEVEGRTACAVCGYPIFKDSDCVLFEGKICCLGVNCSPGPMGAEVGVWNGKRFIDGLLAGRIKIAGRDLQG